MYEIDYLAVGEETRTGDAIALRFTRPDTSELVVVIIDGGFAETGQKMVDHVRMYYGNIVDLVVCTHPDGDHINGLSTVLEQLTVRRLLIHRPALHGFGGDEHNSNSRAVEDLVTLAESRGVTVDDQYYAGTTYFGGALAVVGPTENFYKEQLAQQSRLAESVLAKIANAATVFASASARALRSLFSDPGEHTSLTDNGGTTPRNNSSIVLDLLVDGERALFTGDAGVPALEASADQIAALGRTAVGLAVFDVPHHGSRHNLTSALLDQLLGPIAPFRRGNAIASVGAKASEHPRWEVANAIKRRGYPVFCTRGQNLWHHTTDAPPRWNYSGSVEEVGWLEDPDAA